MKNSIQFYSLFLITFSSILYVLYLIAPEFMFVYIFAFYVLVFVSILAIVSYIYYVVSGFFVGGEESKFRKFLSRISDFKLHMEEGKKLHEIERIKKLYENEIISEEEFNYRINRVRKKNSNTKIN